MKHFSLLFTALLMLGCASTSRQNARIHTPVAPKKLIKDVDYVQKTMKKIHPDLYWYISQEDLDYKFDSIRKTITQPMTPNEFYLKISPVVAAVRQGHMSVVPLYEKMDKKDKKTRKKYKKSVSPLAQFEYYWDNDELYIYKNNSKDSLISAGSKVLSIENITPKDIYRKYRKTFTSDGYNTTFIAKRFSKTIVNYYTLELGYKDSLNMTLSCNDIVYRTKIYRDFKENTKTKIDSLVTEWTNNDSLNPFKNKIVSKEEKKEKKKELKEKKKYNRTFGFDPKTKKFSKELTYPIRNDSTIAVLTIRNFSQGNAEKAYDSVFSEIEKKHVQTLVIDLRGNTGGRLSDIKSLYEYLALESEPFVDPTLVNSHFRLPFDAIRGKSVIDYTLLSPFYLVHTIALWSKTYKADDGHYYYKIPGYKAIDIQPKAFKGKLFVLIDGATFSASSIISSNLKSTKRAVFVGEETGGAYNGTVAGRMPILKLPHSKLKWVAGIMSIKPYHKEKTEGYGIIPDITITPAPEDVVNENDLGLDWIIKHLDYSSTSK